MIDESKYDWIGTYESMDVNILKTYIKSGNTLLLKDNGVWGEWHITGSGRSFTPIEMTPEEELFFRIKYS